MNTGERLTQYIQAIAPADERARQEARARWAQCSKPLGSLGQLETALEDIAALTGSSDIDISARSVLVFCADNGVVAQGVTQTDSSVTGIVARNLAARRTSVCRMAAIAHCEVVPVDVGMLDFVPCDGVLSHRVGNGTGDISCGPAMTRQQAEQAICVGIELVCEQVRQDVRLIATGEMGIGNTTTASAVASVLLQRRPEEMTGRGSGLTDKGLQQKIAAIARAIAVNQPSPDDPLDVLAKVGGYDIAALCGAFLGGAIYRVPILVDGFISSVGALCAVRLCPAADCAVFPSHASAEPAGMILLNALHRKPLITAGMRLGEGTGAVAAMPLLDMARAVYTECYTFEEGGIEAYQPLGGMECSS